jgi:hypothetical protein
MYQNVFVLIAPVLVNQRHRAVAREYDLEGIEHPFSLTAPPSWKRARRAIVHTYASLRVAQ